MSKPFDVLAEGLLSEKAGATGFELGAFSHEPALARRLFRIITDVRSDLGRRVDDVGRRSRYNQNIPRAGDAGRRCRAPDVPSDEDGERQEADSRSGLLR